MVERSVVLPGTLGLHRVGTLQVADHGLGRPVQAVEVEPVDTYPPLGRQPVIVTAQPFNERQELPVAPHPGREALEIAQGLFGAVLALALHEAVDTPGVWPVAFDGDGIEALATDQRLRDLRPHLVELGRAVRGFAKQNKVLAASHVEQRLVVRKIALQAPCSLSDCKEWGKRGRHGVLLGWLLHDGFVVRRRRALRML